MNGAWQAVPHFVPSPLDVSGVLLETLVQGQQGGDLGRAAPVSGGFGSRPRALSLSPRGAGQGERLKCQEGVAGRQEQLLA